MNFEKQKSFQLSAAALHILAMLFMLSDHIWGSFPGAGEWMTCIGRLAFPIYAYLLTEGFFHTHSVKKYALRLFVFSLLSEIPFDLMYNGTPFYPFHQNVLWGFLIALLGMQLMESVKKKGKLWLTILVDIVIILITCLLGVLTFADYNAAGILTVYVFYFFHGRKWWTFLGQFLLLYYINAELLKGFFYSVTIGGAAFELQRQSLALLALVPIWLYRGKQGHHSKPFQYFCYAFYPLHALILYLIASQM